MSALDQDTVVRRSDRVVYRQLSDDSGVLLHLDTAAYFGVNAVGALVWELLATPQTSAELAAGVAQQADDPPPTVHADVLAFVVQLRQHGLVETGRDG